MIRAIVWKELREQGLIALTLLVLGSGILVTAATLADPPAASASPADVLRYLGAGRLATLLLAVTAGTVCGGALFAAEREAGTIGFLESLPASRWDLWRAKMVAGLTVALAQVVVIVAVSAALGLVPSPAWAVEVGLYSLQAFAWGAYGSTLARTTLGSVGIAVPSAVVAGVAFLVPIVMVFHAPGAVLPRAEGALLFLGLMIVTPVAASLVLFTRPDRDRSADDLAQPVRPLQSADPAARAVEPPPGRSRRGVKALLWLSARQLAGPGAVISGLALAAGFLLLSPVLYPFLAWPPLALAAGVLAGVTVLADEQAGRSAGFWGERRLPVGRAWWAKVGVHLAFTLWLLVLLALPAAVRAAAGEATPLRAAAFLAAALHSHLAEQIKGQVWKYLLVPAVYGFAAGTLCGMLFRKAVVAAGVAGLVGGTAAALWLPSLLAGGVAHWQVWLPPAAALLTGRLLARAWSADRLTARGPLWVLGGGVTAVLVIQTAGIGYRVAEVPDDPDAEADVRFIASLPELKDNEGGRNFRSAADRLHRLVTAIAPLPVFEPQPAAGVPLRLLPTLARVEASAARGWVTDDPIATALLDDLYNRANTVEGGVTSPGDRPWHEAAAAAVGQYAVYEQQQLLQANPSIVALDQARRLANVLLARGLQAEAAGDPAAFVDALRTVLALSASLRNQSIVAALQTGQTVERTAADAVWQWLAAMEPDPAGRDARRAAVRKALDVVRAADAADPEPFDPRPHLLVERHVLREGQKAPAPWLGERLAPGAAKDAPNPEADLLGFAWTVPWERERTRRLLGLGFEGGAWPAQYRLVHDRPGSEWLLARRSGTAELIADDLMARTVRRGTVLRLAARLYEEDTGRRPAALADLVTAGCLPVLPADPYTGEPFRYRTYYPIPLWHLERLDLPVIWSVGPNRTDDGGRSPRMIRGGGPPTDDVVLSLPPYRRPATPLPPPKP